MCLKCVATAAVDKINAGTNPNDVLDSMSTSMKAGLIITASLGNILDDKGASFSEKSTILRQISSTAVNVAEAVVKQEEATNNKNKSSGSDEVADAFAMQDRLNKLDEDYNSGKIGSTTYVQGLMKLAQDAIAH